MLNMIPIALGLLIVQAAAKIPPTTFIKPGYQMTPDDQAKWIDSFKPNGTAWQRPSQVQVVDILPLQTAVLGNSTSDSDSGSDSGLQKRDGEVQVTLFSQQNCPSAGSINTLRVLQCGATCFRLSNPGYSALIDAQDKASYPSIALYQNDDCTGEYVQSNDADGEDIAGCSGTQTASGFKSFIAFVCAP